MDVLDEIFWCVQNILWIRSGCNVWKIEYSLGPILGELDSISELNLILGEIYGHKQFGRSLP
jgi:hypothetical protein